MNIEYYNDEFELGFGYHNAPYEKFIKEIENIYYHYKNDCKVEDICFGRLLSLDRENLLKLLHQANKEPKLIFTESESSDEILPYYFLLVGCERDGYLENAQDVIACITYCLNEFYSGEINQAFKYMDYLDQKLKKQDLDEITGYKNTILASSI